VGQQQLCGACQSILLQRSPITYPTTVHSIAQYNVLHTIVHYITYPTSRPSKLIAFSMWTIHWQNHAGGTSRIDQDAL